MAKGRCVFLGFVWLLSGFGCGGSGAKPSEWNVLALPSPGSCELRILAPRLLEVSRVLGKKDAKTAVEEWDFGTTGLPTPSQFQVLENGNPVPVAQIGFRRRVLYAPFPDWDLRIGASLYLRLERPLSEGSKVEVKSRDAGLLPHAIHLETKNDPARLSPVLHVNQTGYLPGNPKKAMVGYYLGTLGEFDLRAGGLSNGEPTFSIVDAVTGREAFKGKLKPRRDRGFPYQAYQQVWEADFSGCEQPGEYSLAVAGLGRSFPFRIDPGSAGAFARTAALGLYHQRCGTSNCLPYTRFEHAACHLKPAEVPIDPAKFQSVNESLAKESADFKDNPRHTAPQLKSVADCLYPFRNKGPVDTSGGHHDAGDYSKYTINSAGLIHHLVTAVDIFPGVAALDNLGIPESGNGKSDVLEEAKWEADFLSKLQDADGGFYFLVYPRDREYENDVPPEKGDPQVVFPKTTSATAAACAALAQCASSPTFKRQFPEAAANYSEKAKRGWAFLEQAIAKYGQDGAYQKITHYGDEYMHDDELAWAACELFLATGDDKFQRALQDWLHPADAATRKWGWWRLFDAYGCAIRSYAFAEKSGKAKARDLNPLLLDQCQAEVQAAGEDQLRRAEASAYGTSFPEETKQALAAGWYFPGDAAFDLAVACQLDYPERKDPRARMKEAILSNLNFEEGCNPVNVTFMTGLGWKRQHETVNQFAHNDRRSLPPTGIPLGSLQAAFGWLYTYEDQLDKLSYPPDSDARAPYPLYDRWGDVFNLSQEFVILNQARELAYTAWLMAGTPLKTQGWNSAKGEIVTAKTNSVAVARLQSAIDLKQARVVWEAESYEPRFGGSLTLDGKGSPGWIEAEAQLPDGRRVFGVKDR